NGLPRQQQCGAGLAAVEIDARFERARLRTVGRERRVAGLRNRLVEQHARFGQASVRLPRLGALQTRQRAYAGVGHMSEQCEGAVAALERVERFEQRQMRGGLVVERGGQLVDHAETLEALADALLDRRDLAVTSLLHVEIALV